MNYEIDLSCALYPNQVVNSDITYTISKQDLEADIINGYEYDLFGTETNKKPCGASRIFISFNNII